MYSNVHGVIGGTAVISSTILAGPMVGSIIGGIVAFLLHDPTDLLGETKMGTMKEVLGYEGVGLVIFLLSCLLSGYFWYGVLGWAMGNLMDLIDKKLYLAILKPKEYKATTYFPCHRRNPLVKFTQKQTIMASHYSSLWIFLFAILIRVFVTK